MNLVQLRERNPTLYLLDANDREGMRVYLLRIGVAQEGEGVDSITRAGQGNMNVTLRVRLGGRSVIVKQSRPWVERFPQIAAPWDRVLSEARFYLLTSTHESVASRMPRRLEVDPHSRVLVLEDLGASSDYTALYAGEELPEDAAREIAGWLAALHAIDFTDETRLGFDNLEMRTLNHEHIFRFPLNAENGLDLDAITPGLAAMAGPLREDRHYVDCVNRLGHAYLGAGNRLLHGDYFPGSWLRAGRGFAVIDPEFAFFGPAEFDVGVMLAHLYLSAQPEFVHAAAIDGYLDSSTAGSGGIDWSLALRFCGVEIMRRLIGVAQLPLTLDAPGKQRLLDFSHHLVTAADPLASDVLLGATTLRQRAKPQDHDTKRA